MTAIRRRLTAATAIAAATATIGLAAPSHAQTWEHEDAVGDTWRITFTDSGETTTPAPEATFNDIATVDARHARRVDVTVTGVDLTRRTGALVYELRAGRRTVWVEQRVGRNRDFAPFAASGPRRQCRDASGSVDRAADVATISVSRRCLGRPDAVRIGVGVATFEESTRRTFAVLVDDGLTDGEPHGDLVMSDRVQHGRATVG